MTWLSRFGRFWYDFVVGDDWRVAVVVIVAVAATVAAVHLDWNGWLILPAVVTGTLIATAWSAVRHQARTEH
jgi:hypothetical protein